MGSVAVILAITIGKPEDFKRANPRAWRRPYEQIDSAVYVGDQRLTLIPFRFGDNVEQRRGGWQAV